MVGDSEAIDRDAIVTDPKVAVGRSAGRTAGHRGSARGQLAVGIREPGADIAAARRRPQCVEQVEELRRMEGADVRCLGKLSVPVEYESED